MLNFTRCVVLALALVATTNAKTIADDPPNIILIMADDVGIEGLGCYGGTSYKTPHLDAMAANGMRFTHAHAQPLCTPTRVQLMTGKYNHRNWMSFGILDPNEKTFGHALSAAGYTTGIFGKWQLQSYDPPDLPGAEKRRSTGMHPKDAGFDRYSLFHALHTEDKGSRYANPTMLEGRRGEAGTLKTYEGRYGEDIWVEQILKFLDEESSQPKFVYYPMALPHWPFQPTPHSESWDPTKPQETALKYSDDMIEYMDTSVGNLMQGLSQRDMHSNTIVLFYSDNGTHLDVRSQLSDGRSIAGGKATPKQTGIHVPLIAHWPEHIAPGTSDALVDASDFVPTLMDLSGASMPDNAKRDGISFAPRLFSTPGPQRETAFFWYDSRPGWDKERFRRHVFAVNKDYKLFRDGRLFRLTEKPLEEITVDPLLMNDNDRAAAKQLAKFMQQTLADADEPPLVDAYGNREHDLTYKPAGREETNRINKRLLETGKKLVYGDESIAQHRLWLFSPLDIQDGEKRPCVVFFHGGGWGGNPAILAPQCVYLQRRGIHTVSVHFRAPKGDVTPADTLRDARKAYRWLIDNAAEHQIDPANLVIGGGSAGGHLSLALLTIALENDPAITDSPRGMVLFNPAIDLVEGWEGGREKCEAAGIDPMTFSPAHHVRAGLPPTLVMSGSEDHIITPKMLDAFQARMKAVGSRCEVTIYPGAGHSFFNYGRNGGEYFHWTMWQVESFLNSVWVKPTE
ncbi:sulfatase-like hydrolase/transferase [Planctomycetes bacterium K23_9]|uniref:Arylsulfatase n=1 Tax=Stieleria marina TaxID=1930275 RepID=A0A517P0Z6_9BACT|nr:Arylsulfatase [Planctomycetes bacterium K23_9]